MFFPPPALEHRSRNAAHSSLSLEERKSRFLFGITTVIRQLTSQPPWRRHTHTAVVSAAVTTLAPLSPTVRLSRFTAQNTLWLAQSHLNWSKLPLQTMSEAVVMGSFFFLLNINTSVSVSV